MLLLIPLFLASILSTHGLIKRSLSPSGASSAFVVGILMMGGAIYVFGVTLIGFYLIGNRATKCKYFSMSGGPYIIDKRKTDMLFAYLDGKDRKAGLEDGHHEGGYRSGWQVLSNSVSALVAACLWNVVFAPNSVHARIANWLGVDVNRIVLGIKRLDIYSPHSWCPLSGSINEGWSRTLIFASLG